MFDHVAIAVADLAASERFYRTVLSVLGVEPSHADAALVEWEDWDIGAADREHPVARGLHVGFRAPSREAVDAFWRLGIDAGYRDGGGPGPRTIYGPDYYGGFLLDPDGNSVEAVHTKREDPVVIAFVAALPIVISINLAACRWINTTWSSWASGSSGARIERQLDKVRPTRVGRAATRWIASDSDVRFAAAAALTCAIVAVTLGRSVAGRPLTSHRVRLAAVSYALFSVGLFTMVGVVAGEALNAL